MTEIFTKAEIEQIEKEVLKTTRVSIAEMAAICKRRRELSPKKTRPLIEQPFDLAIAIMEIMNVSMKRKGKK